MKVKTSELTGPALDWAVAKCEGKCQGDFAWYYDRRHTFDYSTDWAQAGPIIERELIDMLHIRQNDISVAWDATFGNDEIVQSGPTPLIAAMRCYVASVLGDEVDVPEELLKPTTEKYRVVLILDVNSEQRGKPTDWLWGDMLNLQDHESVTVVASVLGDEVEVPEELV